MAKAFHAASGLPFAFSGAVVSMLIDACIAAPDRLMLVLEVDGVARGMLAAQASMHPFTAVTVATEIAWWVEPEHRGRQTLGMLTAYERWAAQRGCVAVHLAGLGADPPYRHFTSVAAMSRPNCIF